MEKTDSNLENTEMYINCTILTRTQKKKKKSSFFLKNKYDFY